MNLRGFRFKLALIIFVIIVGCGLGFRHIYRQTQVLSPLTNQLQKLPGVSRVVLAEGSGRTQGRVAVRVSFGREIPFYATINRIQEALAAAPGAYLIEINDAADEKLLELFFKIRFFAEEAIMTGGFSLLEERVSKAAAAAGVDWELAVDREYIYVGLASEDAVLQRIISRGSEEGKVIIAGPGGVSVSG